MAGGEVDTRGHFGGSLDTERRYWTAHLSADYELRSWLKSPGAFRAPEEWPTQLVFPEWVDPLTFAKAVPPFTKEASISGTIHKCPHLPLLAAWAHGWPLRRQEWPKLREGALWLSRWSCFAVWAYDLDVEHLPLPYGRSSLTRRLEARRRLMTDPLSAGDGHQKWALGKVFHDAGTLLRYGGRRSNYVGSSNRKPMVFLEDGDPYPSLQPHMRRRDWRGARDAPTPAQFWAAVAQM